MKTQIRILNLVFHIDSGGSFFFAIDGWEAKVVLENFQIILFSFQDKAAPTC